MTVERTEPDGQQKVGEAKTLSFVAAIAILQEACKEALELDAAATKGPWLAMRGNAGSEHPLYLEKPNENGGRRAGSDADVLLIAHYRNISPVMAKLLMELIGDLQHNPKCRDDCSWHAPLRSIPPTNCECGFIDRATALIEAAEEIQRRKGKG